MGWRQIAAIGVTIGLNALDGFDVLAISFASPGIAAEWGIDRASLGVVLAMELIGMAAGSILLGGVADRMGRRPMIILCLVVMAAGMAMAATATNLGELSCWRIVTGLGIGGMLASINAAAAEHSSARSRHLSVSLMVIGYPIGAVLGGLVVAQLLQSHDWRSIFIFGAAATLLFIPIVLALLPETIPYLAQRRPERALMRVNRVLRRFGHPTLDALPEPESEGAKASMTEIFRPAMLGITLLVTLAYFLHISTFYFIIKWVPTIVVDLGFTPSDAAGVLVWANVGGAVGGGLFGLATRRLALRSLAVAVLLGSALMVVWFGTGPADLFRLSALVAVTGLFANAGVVALYALFAQTFPTSSRATGTGFAIGIGRGGAALSPIVAGLLFKTEMGLQGVALILASGSALAAVAVLLLPSSPKPGGEAE